VTTNNKNLLHKIEPLHGREIITCIKEEIQQIKREVQRSFRERQRMDGGMRSRWQRREAEVPEKTMSECVGGRE
jgi:hypothetical protein